jgi:adenylate kinase family enzyme
MIQRGRDDDKPEIVLTRREVQDKDRLPVLEYFKNKGLLAEING